MTRRIEKQYGDFEMDDFLDAIRCEYDEKLITYGGNDFTFDFRPEEGTGKRLWYLVDVPDPESGREQERVAGPFGSLDELFAAPILDGKSIIERYDELGTCDVFGEVTVED